MVSDNLLWNFEASNDLVEQKETCSFPITLKGRNCLFPLSKLVYNDNYILVPTNRHWVGRHEINPPLSEGPHRDEGK